MILVTVETNNSKYYHAYGKKSVALEEVAKNISSVLEKRLALGRNSKTEEDMRKFLEEGKLQAALDNFTEFFAYPRFTFQEMNLNKEMPLYSTDRLAFFK